MLSLFKRKNNEVDFSFDTNDMLIIFDDDHKSSDIDYVTSVTDDSVIVAGKYKVPLADCEITTGSIGRNFFYRAPQQSIHETVRLAELERNMVLSQITAYNPPVPAASMDWTKGLLFGLVFIAFIIMGISSCSGGA